MRATTEILFLIITQYYTQDTDRGTQTCAGRAAALGHEKQDAETYANKWAIDYLKEDSCHAENQPTTAFKEYGAMRDALNATGRYLPILFFDK